MICFSVSLSFSLPSNVFLCKFSFLQFFPAIPLALVSLEGQLACGCWLGSPGSTWLWWRQHNGRSAPWRPPCRVSGPARRSVQDPKEETSQSSSSIPNRTYCVFVCLLTEGPGAPLDPGWPLTPRSPRGPLSPLDPGTPGGPTGPPLPTGPTAPLDPCCTR